MNKCIAVLLVSNLSVASAGDTVDPHSHAEPDRFLVRHVALDLRADFEAHRLEGRAELTLEQIDPSAEELKLDTSGSC